MIFGNWKVTEDSIVWAEQGPNEFILHRDELLTTKANMLNNSLHYEYILLATGEDWLTENDLFDFNYAFVFAAARFGLAFNYEIFDATLAEQFEQLEAEEEEEDDEDGEWL
jgi:hypothetical protein